MARPIAHSGRRSWWDGSVKTDCGQKIPGDQVQRVGWFDSVKRCPACANGKGKHNH